MKVFVDPACDILYTSYYLYGFKEIGLDVKFSSRFFDIFQFNYQYTPIVVEIDNKFYKIIIDYGDGADIDEKAYNWSDKYFKINCKFDDLTRFEKLQSIGPSFGINIYNWSQLFFYALLNFFKAKNRISNVKYFFSNYKALLKRLPYNRYVVEKPKDNYVFFTASIWKNEQETNFFRLNFIKSCQSLKNLTFEGGFAPRSNGDNLGFDDFVINSRISLNDYLNKLKQSIVVFNTPAVSNCHGWKLAEYLALGKVIISTPISRELPERLIVNKHYLLTDGSVEDITKNIIEVLSNSNLAKELSRESRNYFDKNLSPKATCQLIIDNIVSDH